MPQRTPARVPRNTLSRRLIVEAALAILDDEGLEALTMPRLAAQLGVGTMSLYRHVEGKDDLVGAVAAHVLSGVSVPEGAPDDWEGRVVGYLRALRIQALRHPALARILAERGLTVAPVLDQLEAVHGILRTAAFSDVDAGELTHANTLNAAVQELAAGLGVAVGALLLGVFTPVSHAGGQAYSWTYLTLGLLMMLTIIETLRLPTDAGAAVTR